ncbi:hypothetical protein ACLUWR_08915, partial [Lactobacillus equicursoris]
MEKKSSVESSWGQKNGKFSLVESSWGRKMGEFSSVESTWGRDAQNLTQLLEVTSQNLLNRSPFFKKASHKHTQVARTPARNLLNYLIRRF